MKSLIHSQTSTMHLRNLVMEICFHITLYNGCKLVLHRSFLSKLLFLADMPTFTPTKRIFLDSQILSHWYHFEAQLVGNNIWKKIDVLSSEFWQFCFAFIKTNFWRFVFLHTPSEAPSQHLEAILLYKNIVPRSRTYCAIQKQCLLGFQLRPYTAMFKIFFGCHGNHSNHALLSAGDCL